MRRLLLWKRPQLWRLVITLYIVIALVVAVAIIWRQLSKGRIVSSQVARIYQTNLKSLWFSPTGLLVGIKGDKWTVEVMSWAEDDGQLRADSTLLPENGLERIAARFSVERLKQQESDITSNPAPLYAVAPDASKIAVVWRDYVIVQSLSSSGYISTPKPITGISGVAITSDNLLAISLTSGGIQFYDADSLSLRETQSTSQTSPAGLWSFDHFVVAASFTDSAARVFNTVKREIGDDGRLYFPSTLQRFSLTDSTAFALDVSDTGKLAVATGRPEVAFAGGRLPAPGNVKAVAIYSEKSDEVVRPGVNRVLAGGDFNGIYALSDDPGRERELVAEAPWGTRTLALTPTRLAFANDSGGYLFSHQSGSSFGLAGWASLLLVGAAVLPLFNRTVRNWLFLIPEPAPETLGPVTALPRAEAKVEDAKVKVEDPRLPTPEPPDKLVRACAAGECVLYAGAGLSAQAGLPSWQQFIQMMVDWAAENALIEDDFAHSLRAALMIGLHDSVADSLVHRLRGRQELLDEYLREIFLRPSAPSAAHKSLREIKFSAVLTTNFDTLLERTFLDKGGRVYTPGEAESLLQTLATDEFYVLKLYGALERPDPVLIAPAQFEDVVKRNLAFSRYMEALFVSRTLLFIGSSLEGIEAYLKGITFSQQNLRTHYALVEVRGDAWRAKVEPLKTRYGIEVLPYSSSEGYPEVHSFIKSLTAKAGENVKDGRPDGAPASTRLKRLILNNIGPFEELELEFNANWNILLGDNGVGKSTVLKAIAVAICGEDARAYASRLIRADEKDAEIILETERSTYSTRLRRGDGDSAEIRSVPSRAFEAEGWLALGFPPLRAVSWERPKAAEVQIRRRPVIDDLLPLITGTPDLRPDKLKQWLVNLDYQIKDARSRGGDAAPLEALRDQFFEVITHLTNDFPIRFEEVEVSEQSYAVMIRTDDGRLPIEALSQGMTSLIGWVGILLQRLYEIYGSGGEDPSQRYALVLMDELDAHMHPAWQRTLVRRLGEMLPNVQFIATTHSPLIVGGMSPEQIIRFARDDGEIVRYEVEEEMLLGRADQLLTSDLFGLDTTFAMNKDLEKDIEEYHDLLRKGKDERTPAEEARYQKLREHLKERVPMPAETPPVRKAQEILDVLLKSQADGRYDEATQIVREKMKQLLLEVEKERRKADDSRRI